MSRPTALRSFGDLVGLVAGFGCWAVAFAGFYGLHGWICSVADRPVDPTLLLAGWVVAALAAHALVGWVLHRRWRRARDRNRRAVTGMGLILALLAPITTLASVAIVLPLAPCVPPSTIIPEHFSTFGVIRTNPD